MVAGLRKHSSGIIINKANRAVFLDRDGVLNELVYYPEEGRVGSPMSAKQLRVSALLPETLKEIKSHGYKLIVISNQPGVARKQFTLRELEKMNDKIKKKLKRSHVYLDGEYYCLHHPHALIKKYRLNCGCRKPKPGLLLQAAKDHKLDLSKSFFVGDAISDVKAGKAAGTKTVLIGNMTDLLNRVIAREHAEPDYMVAGLKEVISLLDE